MKPQQDWTQTFFSGFILDALWKMSSDTQTQTEADFLVRQLQPTPGARIADVPCGNGRLSLALAQRGYQLTGLDIAPENIAEARRLASEKKMSVTFEQGDMRELPWKAEFDHAFCFGNSFSYFDDAGNLAFLQAVNGILKPGGRFVLETHFTGETLFHQPLGKRWFPFGDVIFLHDTAYDPRTSRLTSSYTLLKDGKTETKQAVYHIYLFREIVALFETAGFVEVTAYGSLTGDPFQMKSDGLWITARRS